MSNVATMPEHLRQLLELGEVRAGEKWRDYQVLGLTPADTANLIAMATDMELHDTGTETLEVCPPLHAWRALGQLRATAAAGPLINLLFQLGDEDWFMSDLPLVLERIGPPALPSLIQAIADLRHRDQPIEIMVLVDALARIGAKFPETRRLCITKMTEYLATAEQNDAGVNGALVEGLLDLRAKSALPVIAAFAQEYVDEMFISWEAVVDQFQLPPDLEPAAASAS